MQRNISTPLLAGRFFLSLCPPLPLLAIVDSVRVGNGLGPDHDRVILVIIARRSRMAQELRPLSLLARIVYWKANFRCMCACEMRDKLLERVIGH